MTDPMFGPLGNEPKPALRPFFAARVAGLAQQRRSRWIAAYWAFAAAACAVILAVTGWAPLAGIPVSFWIARSNWRLWLV